MANTGYSSPFPTSHDTIGASTLATPLFMPSSPPGPDDALMDSPDRAKSPVPNRVAKRDSYDDDARLHRADSPGSSRASSPDRAAKALDARLADYSLDFSKFNSGLDDKDDEPLPELKLREEDKLSEVGGPEDFTANLERYLMGDDDSSVDLKELEMEAQQEEREERRRQEEQEEKEEKEQEDEQQEEGEQKEEQKQQQDTSKLHQAAVEDEPELGEYSEFGPPIDMSTPSHLLHRNAGLAKDITHLENIEEDPDDEPDTAATPSVRKQKTVFNNDKKGTDDELRRQIAELQQAVQDRDEQLQRNHRRFLEATSAAEQIKHLQQELQRKTTHLDELHEKRSDEALLREHIQTLQKQNEEKEQFLQKSAVNTSDITALQKQIGDMQKDLQSHNTFGDLDSERLDTIAHLREQLTLAQEVTQKRDVALEETIAKLREVTTSKELQLRETNTEIDGLKAQNDDHLLYIERLEADIDRVNKDYQTLENRIDSLETKNRPLEEKNSTLEADLTRAQSQMTAQENALKAMAADLPIESGGNTYTEILELIKDLGHGDMEDTVEGLPKVKNSGDGEIEQLRQELANLQAEMKEISSRRDTLEAELTRSQEQATEAQSLIHSIEGENTRLTKRADELKSSLDKSNTELCQTKEGHSEALRTIERLREENKVQQPSPPPSPPTTRDVNQKAAAQEEAHQAQIESLQSAHATAISTLRTSHADSNRKLRNLLMAAEKRESKLKADLQAMRNSQSARDSRIEMLGSEIERLESVIAAKDETAAAMDQHIARSIEKREKEWERRIDLLLKERDRMGKALMWTWGEKELGDTKEDTVGEDGRWKSKQAYRYKYAHPEE
ncbi:hypothetical protein ASPWEDRAFT_114626 [Aspergillus wentii DTO 134E9]|uniref:Spindle pole body associated protein SnaD n=1 Tax=Aspergillus wentii DTO 134E9 TaxID=1073089 RepID=A0A1L9RDQ9_ASPWE|nr:uncharacterized protein ASPWEDRAFT_114626 [Aspergillus wentii DTO 134E9]KAI9933313.1 hypothetical protein MW887_007786 [Aspergillus wentii]OJJ33044.1 hypothetical protein ASPWEDRAFT_114626 [Aspergillus wentii DTO 134E9]